MVIMWANIPKQAIEYHLFLRRFKRFFTKSLAESLLEGSLTGNKLGGSFMSRLIAAPANSSRAIKENRNWKPIFSLRNPPNIHPTIVAKMIEVPLQIHCSSVDISSYISGLQRS